MAKLIDLTGQKFDKLLVLEKAPSRNRHVYWKCQCDCGNICEVSGESLRRQNQAHNCGCVNEQIKKEKEQIKIQKKNYLVGQRFGKLVVLERLDKTSNGQGIVWLCQCDCGNTKEVPTSALTSKHTQSCGCLNFEVRGKDITNQRFGKLVALYPLPRKEGEKGALIWHCKCDCGNEKDIDGYNLRAGLTQSCGCINYSIGENNIKEILDANKINFIKEYTDSSLKISDLQHQYRFDFAILNENNKISRLIEFDGEQHFTDKRGLWDSKDSLEDIQTRDKNKNQWALEHNIPLVRIPYWERDNITLEMIMGDKYLVKAEDA